MSSISACAGIAVTSNLDLSLVLAFDQGTISVPPVLGASVIGASVGSSVTIAGSGVALSNVLSSFSVAAADVFGEASGMVTISISDGVAAPVTGNINVAITSVNDAPVLAVTFATLTDFQEDAEVAIQMATVIVNDEDDTCRTVQLACNFTDCALAVPVGTSGVSGAGTSSMEVTQASLSALNSVLGLVTLIPPLHYYTGREGAGPIEVTFLPVDSGAVPTPVASSLTISYNAVVEGPVVRSDSDILSVMEGVSGTIVDLGDNIAVTDDDDVEGSVVISSSVSGWTLDTATAANVVEGGAGTEMLTLTGTFANLTMALDQLQLTVPPEVFGSVTVTFVAEDNTGNVGDAYVITVEVREDNDAPVVSLVLGPNSVLEDDNHTIGADLTTHSIADADAAVLSVIVEVSMGTIGVFIPSENVIISGSSIEFSATDSVASALLGDLWYVGAPDAHGTITLTVTAMDQVQSGSAMVMFSVIADAEDPVVAAISHTVDVVEAVVANLGNLAGLSVSDDEGMVAVTVAAGNGAATLDVGDTCIAFTGVGTSMLTSSLSSVSAITDCLSVLVYTSEADPATFADTVNITAQDGEHPTTASVSLVISITIMPVNDVPTFTLIQSATIAIEEGASFMPLSSVVLSDDTPSVTATVTAESGTVSVTLGDGVTFSAGTGNDEGVVVLAGPPTAVASTLLSAVYTGNPFFHSTSPVSVTITIEDGVNALQEVVQFTVSSIPTVPTIAYDGNNLDQQEGNSEVRTSVSGTTLFTLFDDDFEELVVEVEVVPSSWHVELTTGGLGLDLMGGSETDGVLRGSSLSLGGDVSALTLVLNSLTLVVPAHAFDANGEVQFTVREPVDALPSRLSSADGALTISAAVTAVNDAPVIAVDATSMDGVTVEEDVWAGLRFASVSITDADNGGTDEFTVTIAGEAVGVDGQPATLRVKASGMRTSGENAALGALTTGGVQGDGTTQLTLVGTITEIEAVLGMDDLLEYRGSEDWHGEERVLLVVCDDDATSMACSSSGASASVVEFTVDPVADNPDVDVGDATDLTYAESTDASAREIDIGGSAMFVVSDAESETLDVTVEVFVRDNTDGGSSGVPATGFGSITVTVDSSLTSVSSTSTDLERVVLSGESEEVTSVLGTLTLTFAGFYDNSVTVVVTAVDQTTMSGIGSVDVVVTPENDAPVVSGVTMLAVNPDEEVEVNIGAEVALLVVDVDSTILSLSVTSLKGTVSVVGSVSAQVSAISGGLMLVGSSAELNVAAAALSYVGNRFENGAEVVSYVASDGALSSTPHEFAFTITDTPTGGDVVFTTYSGAIEVPEGETQTVISLGATAVGARVEDDDDDVLTVEIVSGVSGWLLDVLTAPVGVTFPQGRGVETLEMMGSVADLDTALETLQLTVPNQQFGTAFVQFRALDSDMESGIVASAEVIVLEDEDAPIVTLSLPSMVTAVEDEVFELGANWTVNIVDVDSSVVTVAAAVSSGSLEIMLPSGTVAKRLFHYFWRHGR